VAGEHTQTYVPRAGDVGKQLGCEVTAYNGAGPSSASQSPTVAVVALAVPTAADTADIIGLAMVTQTVTCTSPAWVGVVDSESVTWQRDGTDIGGQVARTYTPVAADATHQLTCSVVAHNGAGDSAKKVSAAVTVAALTPPQPGGLPMSSGSIEPGDTVECDPAWSPVPTLQTYAIKRDDGTTVATTSTYTAVAADAGHQLSCEATGHNSAGDTTIDSAGSWVATLQKPTPQGLPYVGPADVTYHVGQTISCSPPFPITGAATTAVAWNGTVGANHLVAAGDLSSALRCVGSGTNPAGVGSTSGQTVVTAAATAPYGGTASFSTDIAWVGDTLDCATYAPNWFGSPPTSFMRGWTRDGSAIASQSAENYVTQAADANHGIACHVEGANAEGPGETALLRPIWVLPASAPFIRDMAYTSGGETPYPGDTLTCYPGRWGGGGVTLTYSWLRNGSAIAGEAGSSYLIRVGDVNTSIGCAVTGTNGVGNAHAVAMPVPIQSPPPQTQKPVNLVAPGISGTTTVGSTLTCSQGGWSNFPSTYAYVWKRGAATIAGAVHSTYKLTNADAGYPISCVVTATNNVGGTAKASAAVKAKTIKPVNTAAPKLGKIKAGKKAAVTTGTWAGDPRITYKYQWYLGSKAIKGATKSSYKVPKSAKGKKLSCRVTATDSAGSTTKASAAVKVK
jgi:hypothetical protein